MRGSVEGDEGQREMIAKENPRCWGAPSHSEGKRQGYVRPLAKWDFITRRVIPVNWIIAILNALPSDKRQRLRH